ncbi:MAG: FmdB family zinc ribbon protein [Candidatus Dormibacteria bacterium]
MPTYAYRCEKGHEFEAVQGITEPALSHCVECGTPVRRVVFPVGIVFKGQGFYKNDSRSASAGATAPAPKKAEPAPASTDGAKDGGAESKAQSGDGKPQGKKSGSGSAAGAPAAAD